MRQDEAIELSSYSQEIRGSGVDGAPEEIRTPAPQIRSQQVQGQAAHPRLFELPLRFPLKSSRMPDGDVLILFGAPLRGLAYSDSAQAEPAMVTISADVSETSARMGKLRLAAADFMDHGEA